MSTTEPVKITTEYRDIINQISSKISNVHGIFPFLINKKMKNTEMI